MKMGNVFTIIMGGLVLVSFLLVLWRNRMEPATVSDVQ